MTAVELGLQIVPTMSVGEVVETVVLAEELGYQYCMIADEGFMHDIYALLGGAASATSRIRVGAVTNPYTRHPAVTAAALATVNEMSGGRAFVTLVAGGTMVLSPMGLERVAPLATMNDAITILRSLWKGEAVRFEGKRHSLNDAKLSTGPHDIPIWMAARSPRLLATAGERADGVVLMAKADLTDAFATVAETGSPTRIYLDRLAYTPEMLSEAKELYAYALVDSPPRMLQNLGIEPELIDRAREVLGTDGPAAVASLVTDEMVAAYQIAGPPEQCRDDLAGLVEEHDLDIFMINITSSGLDANDKLLRDVIRFTQTAA